MKIVDGEIAFPDADEFMVAELSKDRTYQEDHLRRALLHVTNWTCALDGGAHVGTWTRLLAGRFARVVAVEPSPDTFEALCWNVGKWGLTNVEAFNLALGAEGGRVGMTLDAAQAARKNTGGRYVVAGGAIKRRTIDGLKLDQLGLLKLDVEGSEALALLGARETLGRCRPIVVVEEKGFGAAHFGLRADATQCVLAGAGYKLRERVGCDEIWGPT